MRGGPSLPSEAGEILQEIRADTRSGATQLAQKGGRLLLTALEEGEAEQVRSFGKALIDAQPAMAPIVNLVNHLFHAIESIQDPRIIREEGQAAIQGFLDSLITGAEKIKGHALPLLKGKKQVMTHSYSSTVVGVLSHATWIEVICPEARPLCEGLSTARELGAKGIRARVVADFAALSLVDECDVVMVGADAITAEGVVNKIGTYGLALAAKKKAVPFYVLVGAEKFLPPPFAHALRIEKRDPTEITAETIPFVTAENFYFDLTPLDLITGVVMQAGVMTGSKVRKLLDGMQISKELQTP